MGGKVAVEPIATLEVQFVDVILESAVNHVVDTVRTNAGGRVSRSGRSAGLAGEVTGGPVATQWKENLVDVVVDCTVHHGVDVTS